MLGDKGNSLGSAGGSNWAGNGKGGQVNLDSVGGRTGNVLRNIDGEWRVVAKNPQPQKVSVSKTPPVITPVSLPVQKPVAAPVAAPAAPPIALDPQIMGRLQAALAPKPATPSTFPARPSVISSNVARPAAVESAPATGIPSSFPARPGAIFSNMAKKTSQVPPGQKVTDVFGPKYEQDPSISGRVEQRPTPPTIARMNPDGSLSMVKDQSRLPGMEIKPAAQIAYPSEEGQIYTPRSLADIVAPKKQFTDRIPQDPAALAAAKRASIVNQWAQNQKANNALHQGLGPIGAPTANNGPTFGPETPAGNEGWQQGSIDPTAGPPSPQQAPSFWDKARGVVRDGLVKTAWDSFTDANKKINAVPGGGKTVQSLAKLAQMLQGDGSGFSATRKSGTGGDRAMKHIGKAPKVVPGPVPPKPGFSWVQWTPGQPPAQIPTNAL